ncbi:MAG: RsmB/NOP family class I SAM-dependent RNA methyltransferase [Verrucomicrobiota bacterium]
MSPALSLPPKAVRKLAEIAPLFLADLEQAVLEGLPADRVCAEAFRRRRELGSRDRRFLSRIVYAWFRWRGWLNRVTHKNPWPARAGLAWLLDADQSHPVADLLLEESGLPHPGPMADMSLEEKAKALINQPGLVEPPAIESLIPDWAVQTIEPDHLIPTIEAWQSRPPLWIRLQSGATALDPIEGVTGHPDWPRAYALDNTLNAHQILKPAEVAYEIQDLASQRVGLLCEPRPGERWWDACCGSGGKALHLADLMDNQGLIHATDLRKEPLKELRRRSRHAKVNCIRGFPLDASRELPRGEAYDGVLVDAPCTGTGTWARNPDARWRTAETDLENNADRQIGLLANIAKSVKPGGRLIYAVCSLTRPETTDIVDFFTRQHSDFEPWPMENGDHTLRIDPWEGPSNGMFVARFKRVAS